MTPVKRLMDVTLALVLAVLLALPFAIVVVIVLTRDGRPLFHVAERMRAPGQPFGLWKLRTMTPDAGDSGVSGGHKVARITRTGRFLRRTRLDEVPQLWNILKGDMSFVGPRPPLRQYVERFPALYARVLQSRPGITGLATLVYHAHEERILAPCRNAAETNDVYCRRCIPTKAHLDLIYQKRRNLCLDLAILGKTIGLMLRRVRRRQR
jgi:lipopolysaccharide/colanic/teichoic acid biosynthesis glycosyltransferase